MYCISYSKLILSQTQMQTHTHIIIIMTHLQIGAMVATTSSRPVQQEQFEIPNEQEADYYCVRLQRSLAHLDQRDDVWLPWLSISICSFSRLGK